MSIGNVLAAAAPPLAGWLFAALRDHGTVRARRAARIAEAAQLREFASEGSVLRRAFDQEVDRDITAVLASRLVPQPCALEAVTFFAGATIFVTTSVATRHWGAWMHVLTYLLALMAYVAACGFAAWLISRTADFRIRQQKALLAGRPSGKLALSVLAPIGGIRRAMRPRMTRGRRQESTSPSTRLQRPIIGADHGGGPTLGSGVWQAGRNAQ